MFCVDIMGEVTIKTFIDAFGVPFLKHPPVQRNKKEVKNESSEESSEDGQADTEI